MRFRNVWYVLITASTLASAGACASYGGSSGVGGSLSLRWDSGPLDRSYGREHASMIERHRQEVAQPRSDESDRQRSSRQNNERKDLERRYKRGKSSHAQELPPSDR